MANEDVGAEPVSDVVEEVDAGLVLYLLQQLVSLLCERVGQEPREYVAAQPELAQSRTQVDGGVEGRVRRYELRGNFARTAELA